MSDFKYQWCSQCRESFPMRGEAYHALEKCGNIFFCPQGHRMHITQDDIVRQRDSWHRTAESRSTTINRLLRSHDGLRSVQTRQRNRLLRGACPYCGKTPNDLVKHINERHRPRVK